MPRKQYPDYAVQGFKQASQRRQHSDYPPFARAVSGDEITTGYDVAPGGFVVERPRTGHEGYGKHGQMTEQNFLAQSRPGKPVEEWPAWVTRRKPSKTNTPYAHVRPFVYTPDEKQNSIDDAWAEFDDDDRWQAMVAGA